MAIGQSADELLWSVARDDRLSTLSPIAVDAIEMVEQPVPLERAAHLTNWATKQLDVRSELNV
jgi:hypothetical protein